MGKVGKLVWIGIIINIITVAFIGYFSASAKEITDELNYEEQQLIRLISLMIIPFAISIAIQIISIPVLFKIPRLGFVLAVLGSLIILPFSLVFLIGYLFSYEKHYNRNLSVFRQQPTDTSLTFNTTKMAVQGVIFTILGLIIIGVGVQTGFGTSFGVIVVGMGIITFYNSYRLKNKVMIGIAQDKLILTPSMYSETYLIPLSEISLLKETRSSFKLHINSADVDRKCTLRKGLIAENNYQETLMNILSRLATKE